MVDITREAKGDVVWYCNTPDGRIIGPVNATIQALDEYTESPIENLDAWAERALNEMMDEICEESCQALSPSVYCDEFSIIRIFDVEQIPPTIPSEVFANIEVMLREISENLDNIDYVESLIGDIDRILARYGLDREDIRDLIEKYGLGDLLL